MRRTEPARGSGHLTNPVRLVAGELARRAYRRGRVSFQLQQRLGRLRQALTALPRSDVGVPTREIDPALDERMAAQRSAGTEIILGDFDQDGGIMSRVGAIRGIPAIGADQFNVRTSGCPVLLVDLDGRLGVRKTFGARLGAFVQELEALTGLERRGCPVPQVMNVDWQAHAITMTFVPGDVVRELLARAGANIRDRDNPPTYSRTVDQQRIRSGRELVPRVMPASQVTRAAAGLRAIHNAGFVLEDVKFGNIILRAGSGEPVFVDLERALPVGRLPKSLADYLKAIDWRKFREHFGEES